MNTEDPPVAEQGIIDSISFIILKGDLLFGYIPCLANFIPGGRY
jgi:hypothetical protein